MKTSFKLLLSLTLIGGFIGCMQQLNEPPIAEVADQKVKPRRPVAIETGKFFVLDGRRMLYGGENENQHFDITGYELNDEQLHYGLGREAFPALLDPGFITVEEANFIWADNARFLLAYSGDDVKAYAVQDLIRHEIVNDLLDGKPIMAAYCILADLGAIYERNYGETELTFGLSGYTYYDEAIWDGVDAFVFWDRETESLLWPLVGKAISGPLKGVKLIEMDKTNWEDTTWKYIKENYPNAQILKSGQDFERPLEWKKLEDVSGIVKEFMLEK